MYLKYKTADGEWRTVTEDGVISRPGMEPSGEWIFLGLQRMGSRTIEFPLSKIFDNAGWVPRNKQGLVSGHYRVADRGPRHVSVAGVAENRRPTHLRRTA